MARSTGPILAVGVITLVNQSVLNHKPVDVRVPLGTAVAAGMFSLGEHASPELAVGLAYVALLTVLFVRLDPTTPAPVESALKIWKGGGAK